MLERNLGTQFSCVVKSDAKWWLNCVLQKKLGQRIAALRKTRKLTQEQLAEALNCSVEFISLVERGVNSPSVAGLEKFARILKVEVRELLCQQFNYGSTLE